MSRENVSDHEPLTPRVLAVIFSIVALILFGIATALVFLADIINRYLPPDLKLPLSAVYFPLSLVIAVTATFVILYLIYALLYKSYRS
jgi:uncharacterized BrkB/YihY/UPF0761 family membrane protein